MRYVGLGLIFEIKMLDRYGTRRKDLCHHDGVIELSSGIRKSGWTSFHIEESSVDGIRERIVEVKKSRRKGLTSII